MTRRSLETSAEDLPLAAPFRIAGHVFDWITVLQAGLRQGAALGRGEACGVFYLDDDIDNMRRTVEQARAAVEAGIDRAMLRVELPPGGARNALDCALWELEARLCGRPVWSLVAQTRPRPLRTLFTIGVDTPAAMAERALALGEAAALKLKLDGDLDADLERIRAVRHARPAVLIAVDANQSYTPDRLSALVGTLSDLRVAALEQPLPRGRDTELAFFDCPVPLIADESFQSLDEIEAIRERYDIVNVKLDKCGGLTEALLIAERARALGLGLMVGNMLGSSWSTAPAFLFGQCCDLVDLDGPMFLAADRQPAVRYRAGWIECDDAVWGG